MKFQKTQRRAKDAGLKMTSMIDVVFLLLIFFLVGTHFRVPEGELDARASAGPGPLVGDDIRITLRVGPRGANGDARPSVLVDGRPVPDTNKQDPMSGLSALLEQLASDPRMREEVAVVIEAEPALSYRWVIRALDLCRRAEFSRVVFAASKRNAGPAKGLGVPG
jgi:biopolymer transport protein ExbD